jgi:hypothetical protein
MNGFIQAVHTAGQKKPGGWEAAGRIYFIGT